MKQVLNITPTLFLMSSTLNQMSGFAFPSNLKQDIKQDPNLHYLFVDTAIKPQVFAVGEDIIYLDQFVNESHNVEIEYFSKHHSLWYGRCTSFVLKRGRKANEDLMLGFRYLSDW